MTKLRGKNVTFGDTTYTISNRIELQTDGTLYVQANTPTNGEKVLVYEPRGEVDVELDSPVHLNEEVERGKTAHTLIVELEDYVNVYNLDSVKDNPT